jgi:hypothetical protein
VKATERDEVKSLRSLKPLQAIGHTAIVISLQPFPKRIRHPTNCKGNLFRKASAEGALVTPQDREQFSSGQTLRSP